MKKELLKAKVLLVALMMVATTAMFVACDDADDVDDDPTGQLPGDDENPGGDNPGGDNPGEQTGEPLPAPAFDPETNLVRGAGTETAQLTVSWGYVENASAYKVTATRVALVTDTGLDEEPVSAYDRETDRTSVSFEIKYGGKYAITIQALGGEGYANSEVVEAEYFWYVEPVTVEAGDLAQILPALLAETTEAEPTFALVAGRDYQINSALDLGRHNVVIKSLGEVGEGVYLDNGERATIVFGANGLLFTSAGLTLNGVNFDCTAQEITGSSKPNLGVINMSPVQYPEMVVAATAAGEFNTYYLGEALTITNCNFKNIKGSFFCPGNNAWSIAQMNIDGCIFQFNSYATGTASADGAGFIDFYNGVWESNGWFIGEAQQVRGALQYLVIKNSTIYNTGDARTYFYRWAQADVKRHFETEVGGFTMENVTIHGFSTWDKAGANTGKCSEFKYDWKNCVFYNMSMLDKLVGGGDTSAINPENNHAGFDADWQATNNKDEVVEVPFGDSAAKYATNDASFTGSVPTELNLEDNAKGGQNFTYSVSAGDPRWK